MEKKLMELKEEFCKFYCSGKQIIDRCQENVCLDENCIRPCHLVRELLICEYCQVENYIKFTRDDL